MGFFAIWRGYHFFCIVATCMSPRKADLHRYVWGFLSCYCCLCVFARSNQCPQKVSIEDIHGSQNNFKIFETNVWQYWFFQWFLHLYNQRQPFWKCHQWKPCHPFASHQAPVGRSPLPAFWIQTRHHTLFSDLIRIKWKSWKNKQTNSIKWCRIELFSTFNCGNFPNNRSHPLGSHSMVHLQLPRGCLIGHDIAGDTKNLDTQTQNGWLTLLMQYLNQQ